jgi:hypothetical protein
VLPQEGTLGARLYFFLHSSVYIACGEAGSNESGNIRNIFSV